MKIQVKISRAENAAYFGKGVGDIVDVDFEAYVFGVVGSEIGNAKLEACKAQAVAARTKAMPYIEKGKPISDSAGTVQAFRAGRMNAKTYPNAREAADATAGEVLTYGGKVLATCAYSASNGGRTTSSEARWGGYRPYLIARDDPWDLAATGGKKTGHGVGMSQQGAKWAAAQGIGYRDILAFYFPGTKIALHYAKEEKIGMTNQDLIKEIR